MTGLQEKTIIAHALPLVLSLDGKFRVLLGQKSVWEAVEDILLQPFWGKLEQWEHLSDTGPRELLEELNGFNLDVARRFFSGDDLINGGGFYGVFSAPSDVKVNKILSIHCWWRRLFSQIPVSEKVWSEMKKPHWYTFREVFDHPKSWTLTKVMTACYGGLIYFDLECIQYLQDQINHPYLPLRITVLEALIAIARCQNNRVEYVTDVHPDDIGLIQLIRQKYPGAQNVVPKKATFQCGNLVSYTC